MGKLHDGKLNFAGIVKTMVAILFHEREDHRCLRGTPHQLEYSQFHVLISINHHAVCRLKVSDMCGELETWSCSTQF